MNFKVSLSEFQKILQKTLPAIPRKSTLPVLEHLHFSLEESKLKIIATDQDITILSKIDVEQIEAGAILVPARKLDILSKALGTTGDFEFITDDETYDIKIKTPNGTYRLKGLNPSEYLDLPELFESEKPDFNEMAANEDGEIVSAKLKAEEISRLANKTVFAVSQDEFRPAMTGVFFEFRSTFMNAVATDSFRLVKAIVFAAGAVLPDELDIIIPARAVELLKKVDEDVIMSVIETNEKITHTRFDIGDTVFITKVIDERFPPYQSVIPDSSAFKAIVSHKEILGAIKRVAIVTSKVSNQIRIKFENDQLYITGEDEESGDYGNESITCDYSGDEMTIGFNFRYLEEALQNIESDLDNGQVAFHLSEPTRPIIIKPDDDKDDLLMLIMPVRLN